MAQLNILRQDVLLEHKFLLEHLKHLNTPKPSFLGHLNHHTAFYTSSPTTLEMLHSGFDSIC